MALRFRIDDANCPFNASRGPGYIIPKGAYGGVLGTTPCASSTGQLHGYDVTTDKTDACALTFSFLRVSNREDVVCWLQWSDALPHSTDSAPITLVPTEQSSRVVSFAQPLVLPLPTMWKLTRPQYTFGKVMVSLYEGSTPLLPSAPPQMTKDRLLISLSNAVLQPFTRYNINTINLATEDDGFGNEFDILPLLLPYEITTSYVATDINFFASDDGYYLLTGANPAQHFQVELLFCNFLMQYSATLADQMSLNDDPVHIVIEMSQPDEDMEMTAISAPIRTYKMHQLHPGLTTPPSSNIIAWDSETILATTNYEFYAKQSHVVITFAQREATRLRAMLEYYGTTAELVFSCGGDFTTTTPFVIPTRGPITTTCTDKFGDELITVSIGLILPVKKLLQPFVLPLQIHGIATTFQLLPELSAPREQPFTKHTNTELAFITTATYSTSYVTADNKSINVTFDTNIAFTTPLIYQWSFSTWSALLNDTLTCTAQNGSKKLPMTQHSNNNDASNMFKDKKVDVTAHAGDCIVMTCRIALNSNIKPTTTTEAMFTIHTTTSPPISITFTEPTRLTTPNEKWHHTAPALGANEGGQCFNTLQCGEDLTCVEGTCKSNGIPFVWAVKRVGFGQDNIFTDLTTLYNEIQSSPTGLYKSPLSSTTVYFLLFVMTAVVMLSVFHAFF